MNRQLIEKQERILFLKRWIKHPFRLGAIAPSSRTLTNLVIKHVNYVPGQAIVELGAGTGTITRGLIDAGIPESHIFPVELDPEFFSFLKGTLPLVPAIKGNAMELDTLIPPQFVGKVCTIVTALPFTAIPAVVKDKIMKACFKVLSPEGELIQFGYNPTSPITTSKAALQKEHLGTTFRNLPPAHVWRYRRQPSTEEAVVS